ncbi:DUF7341 domain-containing protein [Psychromicrobium lacuslunae]|uniref:DUF7341 domain-containing protein n=1 Tax=Psychromicrobium lacuslunae TaxID=1618207 RepID=A0A0D4C1H5_9MICC|nr:hypothetical protein [Psychromicrobium lacuslunae]AJT42414.1 hypothetical protein UM93_14555 [Psychromicrobium lacuslunae]
MTTKLNQLVHELTRPHAATIIRDDGSKTFTTEASLLNQLREAVKGSGGRGASGANSAPIPINPAAHDLYQRISYKAQQLKAAHKGITTGTLESIIQAWSLALTNDHDITQAARTVEHWNTQIRALLDPPKTIELKISCPQCGARQVINAEGEINLAVTIQNLTAQCAVCLTQWEGEQLWYLKEATDYEPADTNKTTQL